MIKYKIIKKGVFCRSSFEDYYLRLTMRVKIMVDDAGENHGGGLMSRDKTISTYARTQRSDDDGVVEKNKKQKNKKQRTT